MNAFRSIIRGLLGFLGEVLVLLGLIVAVAGYFRKSTPGVVLGIGLALVFVAQVGLDKISTAIKDHK